jgi:hypothetical protein
MMRPSLALAFAPALAFGLALLPAQPLKPDSADTSLTLPDANGVPRRPFAAPAGGLAVVFFVTHDCPISNHYAPEIRRTCESHADRRVACHLVYVDPSLTNAAALAHARTYDLDRFPVIVDHEHRLVSAAGAEIAPEAAIVTADGRIRYRGPIDDRFVTWGESRRHLRTHDLRDALDALVAGKPVAQPKAPRVGCIISDLRVSP